MRRKNTSAKLRHYKVCHDCRPIWQLESLLGNGTVDDRKPQIFQRPRFLGERIIPRHLSPNKSEKGESAGIGGEGVENALLTHRHSRFLSHRIFAPPAWRLKLNLDSGDSYRIRTLPVADTVAPGNTPG